MESGSQINDQRYPVEFSVEYPDRSLNRLTTAFRIFMAIPIVIVAATISGSAGFQTWTAAVGAGGILFLPALLMIVFRQKYPRWWYDWNLELSRFTNRVWVYVALMDDEYPSTDEQQSVSLQLPYPDAKQGLNRWLPLVKWLLAIPHYIMIVIYGIAAFVLWIVNFFIVLFTGKWNAQHRAFIVKFLRYVLRVEVYILLLRDEYPSFTLT
jgi:Domain of unknown function (DUF4389)